MCISSVNTGVVKGYMMQGRKSTRMASTGACQPQQSRIFINALFLGAATDANTSSTSNDKQIPETLNTMTRDIELLKC